MSDFFIPDPTGKRPLLPENRDVRFSANSFDTEITRERQGNKASFSGRKVTKGIEKEEPLSTYDKVQIFYQRYMQPPQPVKTAEQEKYAQELMKSLPGKIKGVFADLKSKLDALAIKPDPAKKNEPPNLKVELPKLINKLNAFRTQLKVIRIDARRLVKDNPAAKKELQKLLVEIEAVERQVDQRVVEAKKTLKAMEFVAKDLPTIEEAVQKAVGRDYVECLSKEELNNSLNYIRKQVELLHTAIPGSPPMVMTEEVRLIRRYMELAEVKENLLRLKIDGEKLGDNAAFTKECNALLKTVDASIHAVKTSLVPALKTHKGEIAKLRKDLSAKLGEKERPAAAAKMIADAEAASVETDRKAMIASKKQAQVDIEGFEGRQQELQRAFEAYPKEFHNRKLTFIGLTKLKQDVETFAVKMNAEGLYSLVNSKLQQIQGAIRHLWIEVALANLEHEMDLRHPKPAAELMAYQKRLLELVPDVKERNRHPAFLRLMNEITKASQAKDLAVRSFGELFGEKALQYKRQGDGYSVADSLNQRQLLPILGRLKRLNLGRWYSNNFVKSEDLVKFEKLIALKNPTQGEAREAVRLLRMALTQPVAFFKGDKQPIADEMRKRIQDFEKQIDSLRPDLF